MIIKTIYAIGNILIMYTIVKMLYKYNYMMSCCINIFFQNILLYTFPLSIIHT